MDNLLKRSQLASLAGVSRAYITKECRPGGFLHDAIVGSFIDIDHPAVNAWLIAKGVDELGTNSKPKASKKKTASKKAPAKASKKAVSKKTASPTAKPTGHADSGSAQDAAAIADLTVRQVAQKFGGQAQFQNWLKSLHIIENIRERRLKNEEYEGSLVERSRVESALFGLHEEQNQRLLGDLPKTLARTIRDQAISGAPLETSEREVRDLIGKALAATADKVSRGLTKFK